MELASSVPHAEVPGTSNSLFKTLSVVLSRLGRLLPSSRQKPGCPLGEGYNGAVAVSDLLPALIDRIVKKFAPERIVLFGSQARGDARPDSDLDLLVVLGDESIDRRRAAIDVRVTLADVPMPMDIIVTTPGDLARRAHVNGSVFGPAPAEGKILYERR